MALPGGITSGDGKVERVFLRVGGGCVLSRAPGRTVSALRDCRVPASCTASAALRSSSAERAAEDGVANGRRDDAVERLPKRIDDVSNTRILGHHYCPPSLRRASGAGRPKSIPQRSE